MERAFREGIHGYHETFEEWLGLVVCDEGCRTVEDELLSSAPKEGTVWDILP